MTRRSAPLSRSSRATSSAVFSGFQEWITVVCPVIQPSASEIATPVRASP